MGLKTPNRYLHKTNDRNKRRAKRREERRCGEIRRRLGGCVFMLGLPLVLAGGIILIVTSANQNKEYLPPSLFILGPLLTCLSVLCFITGAILTDMINVVPLINCLIPDNPDTCHIFYKLFKGNNQDYLDQQAAIVALRTAPQKSALRKVPNSKVKNEPKTRHGVRFSRSDSQSSVCSDQSNHHLEKDSDKQSSLVSIRNCKIYPKEGETDSNQYTDSVYTVSQTYLNVPATTKSNDDVFYQSEDVV